MRVGAGDEVDQGQQRQRPERSRDDEEQSAAAPAAGDEDGGDRRPDREDDRRSDVGAEATGGEDEGAEQAGAQEGEGRAPRRERREEAGEGSAAAGDHEDGQQRLELVADAVEAHPETGVRPQQRERGQPGARDHVDRVGDDGHGRCHGKGSVTAQHRERRLGQRGGSEQDEQPFGSLARFNRGAGEQDERQVDDAEAEDPHRRSRQAAPAREHDDQGRSDPGGDAESDHRPPARGHDLHPLHQRVDRRCIDRSLDANRLPGHFRGDVGSEVVEDRRRDVGREDIAVRAGAVGGQVAVEAPPGDPDRQRGFRPAGGTGDGNQKIVAVEGPQQGREVAQGHIPNF